MRYALPLCLLLFSILCCWGTSYAQKLSYNDVFEKIDLLANNQKAKPALELITALNIRARKEGNTAMIIKTVMYRRVFKTYLDGNDLITQINFLRQDVAIAKQPEKSILQSLLAETYWNYYEKNAFKISQRTEIDSDNGEDVSVWPIRKILHEVASNLDASLKQVSMLQHTSLNSLSAILIGDTLTRYLRPSLYDLLANQALPIYRNTQLQVLMESNKNEETFAEKSRIIFQHMLTFHKQNGHKAAYFDAALSRLKYFKTEHNELDTGYYDALEKLVGETRETEVYADALVELAKIYKEDTKRQGHVIGSLVKAVELAEEAIAAFPNSTGAENAENLLAEIKGLFLTIKTKGFITSDTPLDIRYSYKNFDSLYVKIFKISASEAPNFHFSNYSQYQEFLRSGKEVRNWIELTDRPKDYEVHEKFSQSGPLPVGDYVIVAQSSGVLDTLNMILANTYAIFKVSNLVVNRKSEENNVREYMVMDAVDGHPVDGVKIRERFKTINGVTNRELKLSVTDKDGLVTTHGEDVLTFTAIKDQDSISTEISNYYGNYSKEENNKKKVHLFTDRPIYRPGHTVFYKGIILIKQHEKSFIATDHRMQVIFEDVNGNTIAEQWVVSNEYGTFQGSFLIPIGKLNGEMVITTDYGKVGVNVEEYKRPTFEVNLKPTPRNFGYNDTIRVFGAAKSFSGYPVGGAFVKYTFRNSEKVFNGETKTNSAGNFDVELFVAKAKDNRTDPEHYDLSVDVTDIAGETISISESIVVGDKRLVFSTDGGDNYIFLDKSKKLRLWVNSTNGIPVKGRVQVEWFHQRFPGQYHSNYSDQSGKLTDVRQWESDEMPFKQNLEINDGYIELELVKGDLEPGYYKRIVKVVTNDLDTGIYQSVFRIFNENPDVIQSSQEWVILENSQLNVGDDAVFRIAGFKDNSHVYYEMISKGQVVEKGWLKLSPLQRILKFKIKPEYDEDLHYQFIMARDGVWYSRSEKIYITAPRKQLQVKLFSFRDRLQPGEKETWKLKFSNKLGEKQMVELAATLYDSALDKLETTRWGYDKDYHNGYDGWTADINDLNYSTQQNSLGNHYRYLRPFYKHYERLNAFGYSYAALPSLSFNNYLGVTVDEKRKRVIEKADRRLLILKKSNKFYGLVKGDDGYGLSSLDIKLNNKLVARTDEMGIYAISAKPGDKISVSSFGFISQTFYLTHSKRRDLILRQLTSTLKEVIVRAYMKRTRETTVYSSFTVSGREVVDIPMASAEQSIKGKSTRQRSKKDTVVEDAASLRRIASRTNFSESAFFYPQLRTNSAGEIAIEFTIPESLTRYKMRGFAHTKAFETLYFTKELITQKQFAISANAPRFFREGDTIVFSAKLNNMAGKLLKGKALLEFRNALTGNVVNVFAEKTKGIQVFEVGDGGNAVLNWSLVIPVGLEALTYKVVTESGKYSDGEENTIPVLSNSILVTEALPLTVRGNSSKTFTMEKLLQSGKSATMRHQSLTLEFTANPIWTSIQALPYLMEYPYECAEQTMSRLYANSFATGILNSSAKIKAVFEEWQKSPGDTFVSNLDKNAELKSLLLEETPWVRNAGSAKSRMKRLAVLFDLNRMSTELQANFDKLSNMQHANGSFPWFNGMPDNRYITQQIVLNLSQLKYLKMVDEKNFPNFNTVLNKALIYLNDQFKADFNSKTTFQGNYATPLHYLYARSYSKQINSDKVFSKALVAGLDQIALHWVRMSTYEQALAALVLHRNGRQDIAMKIVNSLKDRSQQSDEMGMSWADNKLGWWWYQSPIETQALLIEVFDEVANDQVAVEEMKIWLLKNKQSNDWRTTKATTAACYALLMRGFDLSSESAEPEIRIAGKTFTEMGLPAPGKEAGTGYRKITIAADKVKPDMGTVTIKNNNKGIAFGGFYWQYFEQADKVSSSGTGITIKKELFLQSAAAGRPVLTRLSAANVLKKGDLLKVRIEIRCDRPMEYLHLKDMRSAGFEPINVLSSYKYQDGLGYYESTKDASTNFFIDYMPKGVYVFEYPLRVNNAGNFSNGLTTLQSMYAPEFTTHSDGIRVTVK